MSTTEVLLSVDTYELSQRRIDVYHRLLPSGTAEVRLSELQVGRLIEQLTNGAEMTTWGSRRSPMDTPLIARILGISREEVTRIRRQYRSTKWQKAEVAGALADFFNEHERFPRYHELSPVQGLPTIWKIAKAFSLLPLSPESAYTSDWDWKARAYRRAMQTTWEMDLLDPPKVLKIRNVTLRREAINHYGLAKVLAGAEVVDDDPVHGKLLKLPLIENSSEVEDDFTMYLEVVNSTPEPDGSYAKYHLRVPPGMLCSKQARAWTFGIADGWRWSTFEIGQET